MADAARATAMRAGLRPRAGLGAGARAGLARYRRRQPHLRGLAGECLLEADLHVVAQVGAALAAGTAARARHAKDALEQIGERRTKIGAEAGSRCRALLERGVAEAVIGGALLRILEHLVGLVD